MFYDAWYISLWNMSDQFKLKINKILMNGGTKNWLFPNL